MKIKIQIVIESENGNPEVVVQEVAQLKREALRVEEFGLTLSEAKSVLQGVSDHPKTYFFERPPDRATSSAPKAQSSVRLSVRVATAHNPHFNPWPRSSESADVARRRPTSGLTTRPEPANLTCVEPE
jgi:hypothetical protein